MERVVFFSTKSGNTLRFVEKLGFEAVRIPYSVSIPMPVLDKPFVLVCPTYADGEGAGAVPKPVINFLNNEVNRGLLKGVVASGNRNFGDLYAAAGDIIARKCKVPLLHRFELMGTPEDVTHVRKKIEELKA